MFSDGSFWLAAGFHLHALFGLLAFIGLVLFVIWAARLKTKALTKWLVWLLVVGILGMLLTSGLGWKGSKDMMSHWKNCGQTEVLE